MRNSKVQIMTEAAMMIALATVLAYVKLYELPFGGSITIEMVPLVLFSYRRGYKWGTLAAFTHSIIQCLVGFSNVLYCSTFLMQVGCILLDYVLAFTALGTASFFFKKIKNDTVRICLGTAIVGFIRFICSFLSGWIIWSAYTPEGMTSFYYSLTYNGSYMIPNIIVGVIVMGLLTRFAPKLLKPNK